MPLLDHFRPPLSQRRHWDSFHGAWAEAIAINLNQSLLPERFVAEARVKLGGQVEIDVGTFAEKGTTPSPQPGGVALWAPPKPVATSPLDFQDPDLFEVQVLSEDEGPRLVAAIELVSPANKDRPANRRMFAVKCASYLHSGVSVIIVDVVTERAGNLHAELLELLQVQFSTPGQAVHDLYATVHRTVPASQGLQLESWVHPLTLGGSLPTLPLWLEADLCLPLDLEATYHAACVARRIAALGRKTQPGRMSRRRHK
ncbi:MAG TPA: DUF4058 family protein [Gemmataceae bacterium]|jgi:hypothetical protein|nr:DUF4058 family protein [Gemmataceae bacterium]